MLASVNRSFSQPLLRHMGSFFSAFPLSFMELYLGLATVFLLGFLLLLIIKLIRGRRSRLAILLRFLLVLAAVVAWIANAYCWFWSTGYYSSSFTHQSGLEAEGMSVEDLTTATVYFANCANALSTRVPRDENGLTLCSWDELMADYESLYDPIEAEFPFLEGPITHPKAVHFSEIMSRLDFTGIFFPLTGETYINVHQPDFSIGETIAHEIAHQKGVHLEAECNFLGIAASIQSDSLVYQYSGYLGGLMYLSSALYKADKEGWAEIAAGFTDELRADWNEHSRYWKEMEGTTTTVSNKVYDTFLKANTQPEGLKSYGRCVDLLVLWLNKQREY